MKGGDSDLYHTIGMTMTWKMKEVAVTYLKGNFGIRHEGHLQAVQSPFRFAPNSYTDLNEFQFLFSVEPPVYA